MFGLQCLHATTINDKLLCAEIGVTDNPGSSSLPAWAIALIAVGCTAVTAAGAGAAFFVIKM